MAKKILSPGFTKTALGFHSDNPLSRMMAGFTGFAIAVTLILAMVLPVEAHRTGTCALALDSAAVGAPANLRLSAGHDYGGVVTGPARSDPRSC